MPATAVGAVSAADATFPIAGVDAMHEPLLALGQGAPNRLRLALPGEPGDLLGSVA
jgi:hypothetical protein